jgi:hypothetical protein
MSKARGSVKALSTISRKSKDGREEEEVSFLDQSFYTDLNCKGILLCHRMLHLAVPCEHKGRTTMSVQV